MHDHIARFTGKAAIAENSNITLHIDTRLVADKDPAGAVSTAAANFTAIEISLRIIQQNSATAASTLFLVDIVIHAIPDRRARVHRENALPHHYATAGATALAGDIRNHAAVFQRQPPSFNLHHRRRSAVFARKDDIRKRKRVVLRNPNRRVRPTEERISAAVENNRSVVGYCKVGNKIGIAQKPHRRTVGRNRKTLGNGQIEFFLRAAGGKHPDFCDSFRHRLRAFRRLCPLQIVPLLRNLCDQRRLVANPGLIVEEHAQRRLGIVAGAGEAAEQSTFLVAGRIADAEFYTDIPRSCAGEHEFGFFAVKINVAFLLIVNVAVNRRQAGKLYFRTASHKDPGRKIFRLTIIDAPARHDQRVAFAGQIHPGTVVYKFRLAFATYIFRNLRARKHFHAA